MNDYECEPGNEPDQTTQKKNLTTSSNQAHNQIFKNEGSACSLFDNANSYYSKYLRSMFIEATAI